MNTQRRALDAASQAFALDGFAGTCMLQISDDVGITKPTLYEFYPTKLDLFHAVFDAEYRHLDEDLVAPAELAPVATDIAAETSALIARFFAYAKNRPYGFMLLFGPPRALGSSETVRAARSRLLDAFAARFEPWLPAGARIGDCALDDVAAQGLTFIAISAVQLAQSGHLPFAVARRFADITAAASVDELLAHPSTRGLVDDLLVPA